MGFTKQILRERILADDTQFLEEFLLDTETTSPPNKTILKKTKKKVRKCPWIKI